MMLRRLSRLALALALLALQASHALADNISLRVAFTEGKAGASFTPVHAQVGKFALSPGLPGHAQGPHWRVAAKNAQGAVLHEVAVADVQRRHIEVFNARSGAAEVAREVRERDGAFEVSLPFSADIASVEILAQDAAKAAGPLARFGRAALEKAAAASRIQPLAGATATASATSIVDTGPAAARMDYVFVGDGYTAAEMGKWRADAKLVIDGFMADPLFAANRANMNVRRVDVASNQSGVDEPDRGIYRDTAMDGAFYCYSIDRLLCVNNSKVYGIVGSVLAPDQRDVIIVVSNSTRYGGSGGAVATLSMHASSTEVALHEIGHTAFALADEYSYGTCSLSSEPSEGNVSLNWGRGVKWGSQIAAATQVPTAAGSVPNGTVGAFTGAQYCASGKYRPTENSRMRTLGYPWHAVNEKLVKNVFARYSAAAGTGVSQSGTLASGATANAPSASPGYVAAGSGLFSVQLSGTVGTDFDLSLLKYSGSAWVKVASSTGPTSAESISYNGSAGYYYVQVKSYSGSGSYTVRYSFPR